MKKIILLLLLMVVFSLSVQASPKNETLEPGPTSTSNKPLPGQTAIWLDETWFYTTKTQIQIHFQAPAGWPRDAWIGIIPSRIPHGSVSLNDQHDIAYQFIEKRTSGTMTFVMPGPGEWDFRMNSADKSALYASEMASASFKVIDLSASAPKLWLEKDSFTRNDVLRVHFNALASYDRDAWIGIIPSGIPHGDEAINDQHDIAYQFIEKRTNGTMGFAMPGPGLWDFRMHDTDKNGREVASVSFLVK